MGRKREEKRKKMRERTSYLRERARKPMMVEVKNVIFRASKWIKSGDQKSQNGGLKWVLSK